MALNQDQIRTAQSFLNELFIGGGIIDISKSKQQDKLYYTRYSRSKVVHRDRANCKIICDEIVERKFALFAADKALEELSEKAFPSALNGGSPIRLCRRKPNILAAYIAYICSTLGIFWDDVNTNRTPLEIEQYTTNSTLGIALFNEKCFLSQRQEAQGDPDTAIPGAAQKGAPMPANGTAPTTAAAAPTAPTTATAAAPAKVAGTAKAKYFNGRNSKDARGLVGQPNQKEFPNVAYMLDCEFDKAGANTIFLFVDPLSARGDAGGGINKVREGSGNGWSECTAYFENTRDADAFMGAYVKKYGLAQTGTLNGTPTYTGQNPKYVNLHVAKAKVDKNGYFRVNTDCGECLVKALKLNEDAGFGDDGGIGEIDAMKAAAELSKRIKSYNIADIDVYEKSADESLEEELTEEDWPGKTLEGRGRMIAEYDGNGFCNDIESYEENYRNFM